MTNPTFRFLDNNDFHEVVLLMEELRVPIAGIHTREIYEPFFHYVVNNQKVVTLLAEFENIIVGVSITIIDYMHFWKIFFCKHLKLFFKVLFKKVIFRFTENSVSWQPDNKFDISKYLSENVNDRSWKDSSPQIAKVLYIAVRENFRNQGIAKEMNKHRNQILKQMGVKRIDGKINQNNIAAIKVSHYEGRKIIKDNNGMLFSTLDLN